MKKVFLSAAMFFMISAASMFAQEVQLATLQQGESLQVFYGTDALKNALNSANNGDLITLSAGTFNGANITKAVTIQGAGYVTDVANNRLPSVINGGFTVQLPNGSEGLLIEGIYNDNTVTVANDITLFSLKKSRLNNVNFSGHSKNCLIEQCRIVTLVPDGESENLHIRNSIINAISENLTTATLYIEYCNIVGSIKGLGFCATGTNAIYKNNIINSVNNCGFWWSDINNNISLSSTSTAYNNVFIQGNANDVIIKSGNMTSDTNTLFGYAIDYDDNKTYELTPEAASTFLGTDGTQVGIYGGETPFSNVPTNPQVTQKNIATKSTPDGKLNVSITVKAQ